MRVRVMKMDIELGRDNAGVTCGCPIHHALARTLQVPIFPDDKTDNTLLVPRFSEATLGNIRIPLPIEAQYFQQVLADDRDAKVRPFTFETELIAPE